MKKRLIIIIAAVLALGVVVGVALGIRQCTKNGGIGGEKYEGTFNDPNALPWEPV